MLGAGFDEYAAMDEFRKEVLAQEEEYDESAQFFDVPSAYRPVQSKNNKITVLESTKEIKMKEKMKENTAVATIEETKKICSTLMQTPHYHKMGAEGIFAIVQKAKSVGVDPLDALNGGMFYVQGKVELTSTLMNDLIRRHGHSITKDKNSNDTICILHGKRKDNGDTWSESFSLDDAQKAGIYRNQWLKYPKDMLFARALSRLARQLFPDVIKGCYVNGEIAKVFGKDLQQEAPRELSIKEMEKVLTEGLTLENKEHLPEYLEFCKEKIQKPMSKVIDSWLENPQPFKDHYAKWVSKKIIETKSEESYIEGQANLLEEEA